MMLSPIFLGFLIIVAMYYWVPLLCVIYMNSVVWWWIPFWDPIVPFVLVVVFEAVVKLPVTVIWFSIVSAVGATRGYVAP